MTTMFESRPIHCEKCGATVAVLMPGGYVRVEHKGREFLVYGSEGAFFETTCGARVRGSDRLCGRKHRFTLGAPPDPPLFVASGSYSSVDS